MDQQENNTQEIITTKIKCKSCGGGKLSVFNWLKNIPETDYTIDIVEIRFKNTRKGFYKNVNKITLEEGDIVAVEASPGHDIGIISLTGELVFEQLRKQNVSINTEFKKVYRKAKQTDIEKWELAAKQEDIVMLKARRIAKKLKLQMKIGDVEFQGDGTKAIFYYIADERVDFRQLIKDLAEEFKIRIEMRQIGARQEAGRIGGVAACGRELCCSTWLTNFNSVTTNAARYQELSLNPQKLAGQCGKLKCCLNYEVDSYIDALSEFPKRISLETKEGTAFYFKTDVYKKTMWYSYSENDLKNITALHIDRIKEIIELNKKGIKPEKLTIADTNQEKINLSKNDEYQNDVGLDNLNRFDKKHEDRKRKKKHNQNHNTNLRENKPEIEHSQIEKKSEIKKEIIISENKQNTEETTKIKKVITIIKKSDQQKNESKPE